MMFALLLAVEGPIGIRAVGAATLGMQGTYAFDTLLPLTARTTAQSILGRLTGTRALERVPDTEPVQYRLTDHTRRGLEASIAQLVSAGEVSDIDADANCL